LLFFGRFNDTFDASVTGGSGIRYSVFEPLKQNAKGRACVIVNFGDTAEKANLTMEGLSGEVTVATPFQPDRSATLPLDLEIPPHQLAVVVKK
jgi:hypothetical protein